MKFKNVKEKMNYIDNLYMEDNHSIKDKLSVLSQLSQDKNTEVRRNLAENLVFFDSIEIEKILYDMLFDKNRRVRLEALDTLSIGRQPRTIEKVKTMLEGEGYLIRAYAVATLFDLIVNCYGVNEDAFALYVRAVEKSYAHENNPRVLVDYYRNQFLMNNEEGIRLLEKSYREAVDQKRYDLIWTLLHIFQDIQNRKSTEDINRILSYKEDHVLSVQKELVDKIVSNDIA